MSSEVAATAIRTRGLSKTYRLYARPQDRLWELFGQGQRTRHREVQALRAVDLDVAEGETLGIVGANGSGKSTLLRLICGTLEPTCGDVQVRGELAPLLTLGAGFHREFTGRENVLMSGAIQGMSRNEIAKELFRSSKTIDAHQQSIMKKLDLHDRVELVRYAIREGLVEP